MNKHSANALLAGLLLALASAGNAHAVDVSRTFYTNPTGVCQGALPAFDGLIRKRPLAVQNEGSADAFVTCALLNLGYNSGTHRISGGTLYLQNLGGGSRTVSCTAVNSSAVAAPGSPLYATRSVSVPANANGSTELAFLATDFPGAPFLLPGDTLSVSCNLPPGLGITGTVLLNNAN